MYGYVGIDSPIKHSPHFLLKHSIMFSKASKPIHWSVNNALDRIAGNFTDLNVEWTCTHAIKLQITAENSSRICDLEVWGHRI